MSWKLVFSKHALKDARKLSRSGLKQKATALLDLLREDPFRRPPPYEKLVGDLSGRIRGESTSSIGLSTRSKPRLKWSKCFGCGRTTVTELWSAGGHGVAEVAGRCIATTPPSNQSLAKGPQIGSRILPRREKV